jgi:hypothetical protein
MLKPKPPVPAEDRLPEFSAAQRDVFSHSLNVKSIPAKNTQKSNNLIWRASWFLINLCNTTLSSTFVLRVFSSSLSIITVFPAPDIRCVLVCGRNQRWVSIGRSKTIVVDGGQKS